jgi:acyl-CoA dehydrogenase
MTQTDGLLFNPNTYDPQQFDEETRRLLRATIDWFEGQGKKRILDDDLTAQWPAEFVDFVKREKLFATFLTPSEFGSADARSTEGGSNPDKRWDGARNADLLVHRAGHHPGARADLAEREQGRQAQGRR